MKHCFHFSQIIIRGSYTIAPNSVRVRVSVSTNFNLTLTLGSYCNSLPLLGAIVCEPLIFMYTALAYL